MIRINRVSSWAVFERLIVATIQFAILLVLVRFVLPSEMGIAILCLAIIFFINSAFVSSLSNILLQKDEVDELDYSTAFYGQLIVATIFYSLLYVSAGVLARWLQIDGMETALRIMGITLFFYAISSLYKVHMRRTVHDTSSFFLQVWSAFIAAILCFFLAIFQYGTYAVLLWTFFYQFFFVLLLILFYTWRPRLRFSYQRLRATLMDGWQLVVTSGVDSLFRNGQLVAIGQLFQPAALSFYVRGDRLPRSIVEQWMPSFQHTLHRMVTKLKHDGEKLQIKIRGIVVLSGFVIFPLMTLLFVTAEPLILVLFGERWLMTVPFVQIFSIYYAILSVASVFSQSIILLESSERLMKLDLLLKGILLLLWVISFPFGVQAVAVSMVVYSIISLCLHRFLMKPYIHYPMVQVVKDCAPAFLLSCTMGVLIYGLQFLLPSSILLIMLQIIIGALFYGGLAYYLKFHGWNLFAQTVSALYGRISLKKSTKL